MKKPFFAVIAVFLACFAAASVAAQSPYTGDGGRGKTLAVLLPAGVGLAKEYEYLPSLVQGVLVGDMAKYSALTVIDRQNLEKVMKEGESGIYRNEQDFVKLGGVINADYIMTGTVSKTSSGYNLQVQVSETAGGTTRVSRSVPCTAAELDNFTGIKKAVLEILAGLDIQLTDASKRELANTANQAYINAQTTLAQGITAQKGGTVVEALSRYIQAANYDPTLAEAASRLNILSANVSSGNIGEDTRNDIAWQRDWVKRLQEAEAFFTNSVKEQPYYLVYDPTITKGKTDYQKGTIELSFSLRLLPDIAWEGLVNEVIGTVKEGLEATGRAKDPWGLDWPTISIGKPSPFADQIKTYAIVVEILNSDGKSIGKQTVNMSYGYGKVYGGLWWIIAKWDKETVSFPAVDADSITDRLDIRISSIDGVPAESAAKQKKISIVPEAEYYRIPNVHISDFSTPVPSVIIPNGIKSINDKMFSNMRLTSVAIPNSVTSIGDEAFYGNYYLTSVTIGANVNIGKNAFDNGFAGVYTKNKKKAGTYTWNSEKEKWDFKAQNSATTSVNTSKANAARDKSKEKWENYWANYSAIPPLYFELGYVYEPDYDVGFRIGTFGFYTTWNIHIPDWQGMNKGYGNLYSGKYDENGLIPKEVAGGYKRDYKILDSVEQEKFEWIVGFSINIIDKFLMIPVGVGARHSLEYRLFEIQPIGPGGSFHDKRVVWLPAGKPDQYQEPNWEHNFIFEVGLAINPIKWVSLMATYRSIGFEESSFTVGTCLTAFGGNR